jgi:hypothetical protein
LIFGFGLGVGGLLLKWNNWIDLGGIKINKTNEATTKKTTTI